MGTVLGIDPGVGRWDGVVLKANGEWSRIYSKDSHGFFCELKPRGNHSGKGPMSSGWIKNGDDGELWNFANPGGGKVAVIEYPDWEGEKRSRRSYGGLVDTCLELKSKLELLGVWVLIPSRNEVHDLAISDGERALTRGNKDAQVKGFLDGRGYDVRRGQGLGNADQRDACMAALYGLEWKRRNKINEGANHGRTK